MTKYKRILYRIYDEDVVTDPTSWIQKLSPTTISQCVCFIDLDKKGRMCLRGCMERRRGTVSIGTWWSQMSCDKAVVTPVDENKCRNMVESIIHLLTSSISKEHSNKKVYTITSYPPVINTILRHGGYSRWNIETIDISNNRYNSVFFYIYDENVLSDVQGWMKTLKDARIVETCVCVHAVDIHTVRICIHGYASMYKMSTYSGWKSSLRCLDMRLIDASLIEPSTAQSMVLGTEPILDGPYSLAR